MALHTIGKLLSATEELKVLQARARRVQELQKHYFQSAPPELASASRVKNCRSGMLCISAENAAVAAKLRQLVPRLLASIRKFDLEVTGLRIEVQVTETRRSYKSPKTSLSHRAIEEFDALARHMPESGLKSALEELVERHSKGWKS